MITDAQILTIVLAAVPPTLAVMIGILMNNARLSDLRQDLTGRFDEVNRKFHLMGEDINRRFNDVDRRFNDVDRRLDDADQRATGLREEMNRRFDEVKDVWRSELRRVEEILDARLKHLEER